MKLIVNMPVTNIIKSKNHYFDKIEASYTGMIFKFSNVKMFNGHFYYDLKKSATNKKSSQ